MPPPARSLPPCSLEKPATRLAVLLASAVVLTIYSWITFAIVWEPVVTNAATQPFNLQAEAFRAGEIKLPIAAPPGFAALADPYDPTTNKIYREPAGNNVSLHDLSYYHGGFYIYFGIIPALVLFEPWHLLTGTPLPQDIAVTVFCAVGFLSGAWLLRRMAGTYFPRIGPFPMAATLLAFGLAGGQPVLLLRPEIYEVTISCAHALVMLAVAAVWASLDSRKYRGVLLALASTAYGLAVSTRPSLLFGAVILLAPVAAEAFARSRLHRRAWWTLFFPAVLPVAAIGIAQLIFNAQRFDRMFEFGQKYQLASVAVHSAQRVFSWDYVTTNLRLYFVEPVRWTAHSIFPLGSQPTHLPEGYFGVENPFGILTTVPFVLLSLATFLLRRPGVTENPPLAWLTRGLWLLSLANIGTLCLFGGACGRYEADFLPALMLLAGLGLFALEERLTSGGPARWGIRIGWAVLLGYSLLAGGLAGVSSQSPFVGRKNRQMEALQAAGFHDRALAWYEAATRFYPTSVGAHYQLGSAYFQLGRYPEAAAGFERALLVDPDQFEVHNTLGIVRSRQNRLAEARTHFLRTLELKPDHAAARANLATLDRIEGKTESRAARP